MPKVQLFNTQTEQSDIKKRTYVSKETLRTPKSAFPKTQVHLSSNALAFSSKRKRVFQKAL